MGDHLPQARRGDGGTGPFGRSGQAYHPEYGALLRFGAVVTAAALPGDGVVEKDPCPPRCNACREARPPGAFPGGSSRRRHAWAMPSGTASTASPLGDEEGLKRIEMIVNTAGCNYWIACDECVKVCPLNKGKGGGSEGWRPALP